MHTLYIDTQRVPLFVMVLGGWLTLSVSAWAEPAVSYHGNHSPGFQPVLSPLTWHRDQWRLRSQHDPSFTVELPWALFDPHHNWGDAPRPSEPARPEARPRERGDMWRDDVMGSGSGDRFEVHPEGRILRSRPRSD